MRRAAQNGKVGLAKSRKGGAYDNDVHLVWIRTRVWMGLLPGKYLYSVHVQGVSACTGLRTGCTYVYHIDIGAQDPIHQCQCREYITIAGNGQVISAWAGRFFSNIALVRVAAAALLTKLAYQKTTFRFHSQDTCSHYRNDCQFEA